LLRRFAPRNGGSLLLEQKFSVLRCHAEVTSELNGTQPGMMTRPRDLHPMTSFNASEPAVLHDRRTGKMETWTGEHAVDYRKYSLTQPDGSVQWRDFLFDGWGNVLGG
jgi:hypothetical protein